jgi:hypothetical protein
MKAMVYFAPPIAINEFVLALWLIIKGYNLPAMDFNALKTDNKL